MGGSSTTAPKLGGTGGWPRSNGYIKGTKEREIALRSDVRKDQGITTVIESGRDEEEGVHAERQQKGVKRAGSDRTLGGMGGWRKSNESKRSLGSTSDDERGFNWRGGIKKTTISRQVVDG